MRLRRWAISMLGLFFASILFSPCFAASDVVLKKQPWPVETACESCVPIQFGKLEMRLPLSEIGKILVVGSGNPVLHIFLNTDSSRKSVLFLTVSPDRLMKTYKKSGMLHGLGITKNEQLFDLFGQLPGKNKSIAAMRHIEGIDTANRYFKASKGPIHVYWIQSSLLGASQRVYFVIDGEKTVYMLAGSVTSKFYEAVLANLRIVNVP